VTSEKDSPSKASPAKTAGGHTFSRPRLGTVGRQILLDAASPTAEVGFVVNAPRSQRTVAQSRLRAARRLAADGLIDLAHISEAASAHDPRRTHPFYKDGSFWLHPAARRRQYVRRALVWRTPLGEGVRLAFASELSSGRPIRWSPKKVAQAERYAADHPVSAAWRRERVRALDHLELEKVVDLNRAEAHYRSGSRMEVEYLPDYVVDDDDETERWRAAVRAARRLHPKLGSGRLLEEAEQLYFAGPPAGS